MAIKFQFAIDGQGNNIRDADGRPIVQAIVPVDSTGQSHGMLTGPATGVVTLEDGTTYDVTPDLIQVAAGHGVKVGYHIAKKHEVTGKLTELVHGTDYDGPPCCAVIGHENAHALVHSDGSLVGGTASVSEVTQAPTA
jgi:hypothetical protein